MVSTNRARIIMRYENAVVFREMMPHVLIQFLAERDILDAWLDALLWIIDVNTGSDRSMEEEEVYRANNVGTRIQTAIQHIAWDRTLTGARIISPSAWEDLDGQWRVVHKNAKHFYNNHDEYHRDYA